MSSPRNGGHGLVWAVATEALPQAEELEGEAEEHEQKAREKRLAAAVLRQLHAIAAPHIPDQPPETAPYTATPS